MCNQFRDIKDGFQRELDGLNESAKKCCTENEAIRSEICSLKCRVESSKKQRERAENDVRCLCKQLKKENGDQKIEREELCKSIKKTDCQIRSEIHFGYESKLHRLLNDLRNQFKDKMCIAGIDIIADLIRSSGDGDLRWGSDIEDGKVESEGRIESNIKIIFDLQGRLTACNTKRNNLKIQIGRKKREHDKNMEKIRCMQRELAALLNQFQDLIDIKLLLDFELAAYNQMLAIEEYRFNITDMCCKETPADMSACPIKRKGPIDDDEPNNKNQNATS